MQTRIDYEQNRRNQKKQRKYNRDNQLNQIQPSLNIIQQQDDEKQHILHTAPSNHNGTSHGPNYNTSDANDPAHLQNNPLQSQEKDIGIFLNELTQNIDEYKYDTHDTVNDIKHRIKRCIKLAKLNKFKKADAALNPTSC